MSVDAFLSTLQRATTLAQVQEAFAASHFSDAEKAQINSRIEGTSALKTKLESLVSDAVSSMLADAERWANLRAEELQNDLNRQRSGTFKEFAAVIHEDPATHANGATIRCAADKPTINSASPATPGVEFAIQGRGFGEDPGTVGLSTGGRILHAQVNSWNSCAIFAQIGADVDGVRSNAQASLSVTTNEGKTASATIAFSPSIETRFRFEHGYIGTTIFGHSEDWTYWDRHLINDWYVVSTSLQHFGQGHATITSAPTLNVPNGSSRTKGHSGLAAGGGSWGGWIEGGCEWSVTMVIAGPKAVPDV